MTHDLEQGSEAWLKARLGSLTGSRVKDMLAKGQGITRQKYMLALVAERLTGEPEERFQNAAMQRGTELEAEARAKYEVHTDTFVEQVGFVKHPTLEWCGASPDGLVGPDGMVQIKCPSTAVHLATFIAGEIPSEYLPQMYWEMACTGRAWNDFVSYDDRLPEDIQLFVKRLPRDDAKIAAIEAEAVKFLAEVEEYLEMLLTRKAAV